MVPLEGRIAWRMDGIVGKYYLLSKMSMFIIIQGGNNKS